MHKGLRDRPVRRALRGADGAPGLVYRGTYSSTTNYALSDAVTYNGSSYISLVAANHGNSPDVSAGNWSLLAAMGSAGAAGVAGPAGPQGLTGATGAAGPAGAPGGTGAPGIDFRGGWNTGLNYSANDAVTFGGASYLALVANMGVEPDTNAQVWATLAAAGAAGQAGVAGPSGPSGAAATVAVGTVSSGSTASVTNSGTASAAVLNFVLPQGTGGATGSGTGSASGIPFQSMVHSVSYAALFYSVNNTNQAATETSSVVTWVPAGCTATSLTAYSQQNATITITLRSGTSPTTLGNTTLSCQAATGGSCTATGLVSIPAGSFVDLGITHADSNATPVWTALACN